jgi:hypothetical protein
MSQNNISERDLLRQPIEFALPILVLADLETELRKEGIVALDESEHLASGTEPPRRDDTVAGHNCTRITFRSKLDTRKPDSFLKECHG